MIRVKFLFPFVFFTLIFLFYPGDSPYFHIFSFHRELFAKKEIIPSYKIAPVPALKSTVYPPVSAEGIYVVDIPSFTPVLEKNANERFLPASITKIITALVAYDVYKPDQVITVKRTIGEGQIMNLVVGEKISVENLLFGTLIHSANDAAFVLADNYGFEKFITLMNKKAQKLHMTNSHFNNSNGLDDWNNYSTPFDLALAARELLKNHYLAKIVSIKEITISDADYQYFHQLTNVNKLLGEIQGIGGLKTGYTANAGENLISFYKKNNHQFIIVILKSQNRFEDTKSIVGWIDSNIEYLNPSNNLQ